MDDKNEHETIKSVGDPTKESHKWTRTRKRRLGFPDYEILKKNV